MILAVREALGPVYSLRRRQNRPITKVSLKLLPSPNARYFWLASRKGKKAWIIGSYISHDVGWVQNLKNGTLRFILTPCTLEQTTLSYEPCTSHPSVGGTAEGNCAVYGSRDGCDKYSYGRGKKSWLADAESTVKSDRYGIAEDTSPINVISELVYELLYYQTVTVDLTGMLCVR